MKAVIIYGPPAVEKLTVAKELAKLIDYKIFHNHLSIDVVSNFFKWGTEGFWKENRKIRNLIYDILARNKINSIFTFAYSGKEDNITLKKIKNIFEKEEGKVYFVRSITDKKILEKRVIHEPRKKYGKLKNKAGLQRQFNENDFFLKVPFKPHLEIDNTKISSKKSAKNIIERFKLK